MTTEFKCCIFAKPIGTNQNLNYMKCTHNTLASLLSAWDKLEVVGINPDNHKSILTNTFIDGGTRKIAIEYRLEDRSSMSVCIPYVYAFLVMYDQNGHRRSVLKNGAWGCHGDDILEFKRWFREKLQVANDMQEQRIEKTQDSITKFLS